MCEAAAGVMEMQIQGKLCIIIVKYTCDLDDEQHNVNNVNEEWIKIDGCTVRVPDFGTFLCFAIAPVFLNQN